MFTGKQIIGMAVAAVLAATLVACAADDATNPDPIKSTLLENASPNSLATTTLFYVTDREADARAAGGYGGQWSSSVSCGTAEIDIPSNRMPGDARGAWTTAVPNGAKAAAFHPPEQNAVVPAACGEQAGVAPIVARIEAAAAQCHSVLIFVHGFNVSFSTAVFKTAQLAHDSNFGCAAVAFSWASVGVFKRYLEDAEVSGLSQPRLIALLRALAKSHVITNISIIAHSVGTRVVLMALAQLSRREGFRDRKIINELVLAAPDIGTEMFKSLYGDAGQLVRHTTVYVSRNDAALAASCDAHGGDTRAGEGPGAVGHFDAMDVIDASDAPADKFGHSYFAESSPVVADIAEVLSGKNAAQRETNVAPGLKPKDGYYKLEVLPGKGPSALARVAIWFFNCRAPRTAMR